MSRRFGVFIVFLSLARVGLAQGLPDTPSVIVGRFPSNGVVNRPLNRGAVAAARAPWVDPRIADASYWTSTFALVATTVVNVEMTSRCAEQHTCLTQIAPTSTRGKFYAYALPTDLALSYLAYKLKSRTRMWWLPQAVFTGANLFSAGRSYGRIK